jgi:hypothetical protein
MAVGEKKTDAQKVADLRKAAEDKTLPQAVRNTYLDRANQLERSGYEKMKMTEGLAKGGAVKKKPAKPAMAVMIGLSPTKKMAKGGKVPAAISEYGGKEKYPSEAAMMKHEKKEPKKMEKKEKKMAFGGDTGQPMNARQNQKQQAAMLDNFNKANAQQQAAMANAQQAKQAPAGTGGGARMLSGEEAKRMGLGMAKGGSVKKKPMKGIINKFV